MRREPQDAAVAERPRCEQSQKPASVPHCALSQTTPDTSHTQARPDGTSHTYVTPTPPPRRGGVSVSLLPHSHFPPKAPDSR